MGRAVSDIRIRFATADDAGLLLQLITKLADYATARRGETEAEPTVATVMPPYAPDGQDNCDNLWLQRSADHPWAMAVKDPSVIGGPD
jgi:hypothetical protein